LVWFTRDPKELKIEEQKQMIVNMKGESLASLYDLTKEETEQIFETSELLKLQLYRGQ